RLGQIPAAQADLTRIRAMLATHSFEASPLEREPQVAAEILLAQGKDREAFEAFSAYDKQHNVLASKRFNVGVRQLTDELRGQLQTARKDAQLQRQATRSQ